MEPEVVVIEAQDSAGRKVLRGTYSLSRSLRRTDGGYVVRREE